MWKKIREASSSVSLSSVKNIFRNWTYDKFEGDEDAGGQNARRLQVQTDLDSARDRENNVVLWSKTERVSQQSSPDKSDDSDESDDEFGFESPKTLSRADRFSTNTDLQQHSPYAQASRQTHEESDISINTSKEQVCEFIDSYAQKQYRPLGDEEYSYEDIEDRPKKSEKDTSNLVFRRAEDVHNSLQIEQTVKDRISSLVSTSGRKLSRSLSRKNESGHIPNPKTEVKEIVNSFSQRRYQQLDDSDDSFHSCHDSTQPIGEIPGLDENNVFHKADEVHTDLKQKSSKLKGTKKVSNLFRRMPCIPDSNTNSSLR